MKIGNLELKNKVFLSPMAGVTDLPFRLICKEQGCGLLYTEMINGKALCYDDENTKKMLKIEEEEHPVAVQIFGSEPEFMGRAAEIMNDYSNEILDINMGCPAPKVVKNGDGSALMKNPKLAEVIDFLQISEDQITNKANELFEGSGNYHDARFDTAATYLTVIQGMKKGLIPAGYFSNLLKK